MNKSVKPAYSVLKKPFNARSLKAYWANNPLDSETRWVKGVVEVPLSSVIHVDFEGFLDLVSELLIGSSCLMNVGYRAVGVSLPEGDLHIEVQGEVFEDDLQESQCPQGGLIHEDMKASPSEQAAAARVSNEWSEYDPWPRSEWQRETSDGDTNLGYWDWVEHQVEANEE